MNAWLIRIGLWLATRGGWTPPAPILVHDLPALPADLVAETRRAVTEADPLSADGEYKRHQVYAKLRKRFPQRDRSELAFAIEWVIQERRPHA